MLWPASNDSVPKKTSKSLDPEGGGGAEMVCHPVVDLDGNLLHPSLTNTLIYFPWGLGKQNGYHSFILNQLSHHSIRICSNAVQTCVHCGSYQFISMISLSSRQWSGGVPLVRFYSPLVRCSCIVAICWMLWIHHWSDAPSD